MCYKIRPMLRTVIPLVLLFLLVPATAGFASPLSATQAGCDEEGGAEHCEVSCTLCICCSPGPLLLLGDLEESLGRDLEGLWPEQGAMPIEALPRDILHVPEPAPGR